MPKDDCVEHLKYLMTMKIRVLICAGTGTCLERPRAWRLLADLPLGPSAAGGQRVTVMTPVLAPSAVCTPCTVSWSLPNCGRTSAVPVQASCEDSGMHLRLGTRASSSCLPGNLPPQRPVCLLQASLTRHTLLLTVAMKMRLTFLRGLFWVLGSQPY